jgi:hypothetical protein
VQQAADELLPLGGGRRGSGTRGLGPRPLNSHVKGITLKIGFTFRIEQLGEVWGQQLIPKLPALTLLRYPARVQLLSAKEIGQRSTAGQMLIWQKRYTGGLCKTLRSRPLQHVFPGQRASWSSSWEFCIALTGGALPHCLGSIGVLAVSCSPLVSPAGTPRTRGNWAREPCYAVWRVGFNFDGSHAAASSTPARIPASLPRLCGASQLSVCDGKEAVPGEVPEGDRGPGARAGPASERPAIVCERDRREHLRMDLAADPH